MDEQDLTCYDIGSSLAVLALSTEAAGEPLFKCQKQTVSNPHIPLKC
jgi:hypothetical protein